MIDCPASSKVSLDKVMASHIPPLQLELWYYFQLSSYLLIRSRLLVPSPARDSDTLPTPLLNLATLSPSNCLCLSITESLHSPHAPTTLLGDNPSPSISFAYCIHHFHPFRLHLLSPVSSFTINLVELLTIPYHSSMASVPSIITASFDGTAENYKLDQDHKREVDKRRKYALGVTEAGPFSRARPVTPLSAQ